MQEPRHAVRSTALPPQASTTPSGPSDEASDSEAAPIADHPAAAPTHPTRSERPHPRSQASDWQRDARQAEQREARLRAAASYVADALYDGWAQAVAQRVWSYVSHGTWQRITSGGPAAAASGSHDSRRPSSR